MEIINLTGDLLVLGNDDIELEAGAESTLDDEDYVGSLKTAVDAAWTAGDIAVYNAPRGFGEAPAATGASSSAGLVASAILQYPNDAEAFTRILVQHTRPGPSGNFMRIKTAASGSLDFSVFDDANSFLGVPAGATAQQVIDLINQDGTLTASLLDDGSSAADDVLRLDLLNNPIFYRLNGGGGVFRPATYEVSIYTPGTAAGSLIFTGVLPLDPVAVDTPPISIPLVLPRSTVGPGIVVGVPAITLFDLPAPVAEHLDALDINFVLLANDPAKTNAIQINLGAPLDAIDLPAISDEMSWAGTEFTDRTGTDLSWDDGDGILSEAGGDFDALLLINVGWD